jgi:hypothetical protein
VLNDHKDPLRQATPDVAKELFERFAREASGFPRDAVIGAAANLLINGLRQEHGTRDAAERAFDEMFGKMKTVLVNHYDSLGRKRGIFPYDQTLTVPFMKLKKL